MWQPQGALNHSSVIDIQGASGSARFGLRGGILVRATHRQAASKEAPQGAITVASLHCKVSSPPPGKRWQWQRRRAVFAPGRRRRRRRRVRLIDGDGEEQSTHCSHWYCWWLYGPIDSIMWLAVFIIIDYRLCKRQRTLQHQLGSRKD